MEKFKVKIRNTNLQGNITDEDALYFASLFYDNYESGLAKDGKPVEAFLHLSDRYSSIVSKSGDQKKGAEELNANMMMQVQNIIMSNFEVRRMVAQRLRECLPDMDNSWVYVNSDSSFGIRLNIEELFTIIFKIMELAIKLIPESKVSDGLAPNFNFESENVGDEDEIEVESEEVESEELEDEEEIDRQMALLKRKKLIANRKKQLSGKQNE